MIAAEALPLLVFWLLLSWVGWGAWALYDAVFAFDHDPDTHTASERIKAWRRAKGVTGDVALGGPILALLAIPIYLFLHLVLELV